MRRIAILSVVLIAAVVVFMGCPAKVPSVPIKPVGNTATFKYATEDYLTMSTDGGKKQIRYVFDWGDTKIDTTDLFNSGDTVAVPHTWNSEGTYSVKAKAINADGKESGWSDALSVTVGPNNKPNAPDAILGVDGGIRKQYITIATKATDPDADSVYIIFYYDTTQTSKNSGWLGPVAGGTYVYDSVKYTGNGTYYMIAKAKDIHGAISDPSPVKTMVILPIEISWTYNTIDGDAFYSSPAVAASPFGDTVIFIGCDDGNFYGLNARTGSKKGSFLAFNEDAWSASPAISADGQRVYMADDGGWFYCFNSTSAGSPISHYPPADTPVPGMNPFFTTPAVSGNNIYEGCDDGYLYLFVDDGAGNITTPSRINTFADVSSSPAISADGSRVVFGNDSGYVYCVDNNLGLVWRKLLGAPTSSSPALTASGTIYIGCDDNNLYSLSLADGSNVYPPFLANDFISTSPVVDANENVYFGTDNGTVYCVRQGNEVWHKDLTFGENISASLCLAPDTTAIINTDDGTVYGIDIGTVSPGTLLYRIELPLPPGKAGPGRKTTTLASSPTIVPATGMYVCGSTNGGVFSIHVDKPSFNAGSLPANALWPKFHHDITNRGKAQ